MNKILVSPTNTKHTYDISNSQRVTDRIHVFFEIKNKIARLIRVYVGSEYSNKSETKLFSSMTFIT